MLQKTVLTEQERRDKMADYKKAITALADIITRQKTIRDKDIKASLAGTKWLTNQDIKDTNAIITHCSKASEMLTKRLKKLKKLEG